MTKRQVQQLSDANLLPKGSGIGTLKRAAVVGAFHAAGAPLLMAARLAEAIAIDGFDQYDGEVPSGLINFDDKLPESEIEWLFKQPEVNDYWRHRAALRHPDIYRPGEAFSNDALIAIVDRSLFFYGNRGGQLTTPTGLSFDFVFGGWIEGWERGDIVRIVSKSDRIDYTLDQERFSEAYNKIELEAQRARECAIGTIVVNISLAVRTALDRIADHRNVA